ncbi:MAG: molybdenum cofactor guanylyltransferase MobA [Pasteurellaceae bacterium]|nr:molybdenum cofactor guanylyltransferase MobA [Pasteurellaceae bacterium]
MTTISAVILAGGRATRMNGADKGLQLYRGQSLVAHILQRLRPQVSHISINANRNLAEYVKFGVPVFSDDRPNFQGPLSGMLSGLKRAETDAVLFVPCDCPFLPLNLLEKLKTADQNHNIFNAYANDGERSHPTFCLLNRSIAPQLETYLNQGERRVLAFLKAQQAISINFNEQKNTFINFNSLSDLNKN